MAVQAQAKYVRVAPRKAREAADLIRGDDAGGVAVGEEERAARLGHGLAADEVDDLARLAWRDTDVLRLCPYCHDPVTFSPSGRP